MDWVHVHTASQATLFGVGLPSRVGRNLRQLREAADLSQEGLAKLAHVSRATIAHIETGVTEWLTPKATDKLARALGVPPGAILEDPKAFVTLGPASPHIPTYLAKYEATDHPTKEELDAVRRLDPTVWRNIQPSAESVRAMILARRSG